MRNRRIAIIGGTGKEGSGLAIRLADAGHDVSIGSRDAKRASEAAAELGHLGIKVAASGNRDAAEAADIVFLTVPYAAQLSTLESIKAALQGKILVDATVPLVPPRVSQVQLPAGASAVVKGQSLLGEGVRVVSAFQNVSAHHLRDLSHTVDCDVIVCGNDASACDTVIEIARSIRLRSYYGGPLCNSAAAEALTSVLIAINRRYKVPASGIRLTGVPDPK